MSTTSTIFYNQDSLTINIRTASPAALHHLLLRGMISALKHQMLSGQIVDEELDGLAALADVLGKIVPAEMHLVKAYQSPAA